mgnify:CR=1 FL=1
MHHLTYARLYAEELEDLAGWCKHCHAYTHGKALWDPREDQLRVPLIDSAETPTSVCDAVEGTLIEIDRRTSGEASEIPTGFVELDNLTGGLHKSELVILASRPSMGKTALALNIADHAAINARTTTLIVSMEMSRIELAQRMLCARGKINGHKFRSGFLSGEGRGKLTKASAELCKAPLHIDDSSSRSIPEIAACARRLREAELGLVIVDYLQLIQPDNSKDPRQERVAKISRRLKGLARELAVPVLCLAQLNRQVEAANNNRPRLSHLRESGAIEQDADIVLLLHRDEYRLSPDEARDRDLVGRAENLSANVGISFKPSIKLRWFADYACFDNLVAQSDDEFTAYAAEDAGF